LRGDTEPIRVGARTNVQGGCILHADPAVVGEGCVLGHNAVVHGCEIEDYCLVGMGYTILNGAKIGEGAVVPEGREFPPHSLIVGVPAKRVGDVSEEQAGDIARGANEYVERAKRTGSRWEAGARFGRWLLPPLGGIPGSL
jgi:carbonic anhydrase/acetyltransferase-like protein (isoleucine patch superfamily)